MALRSLLAELKRRRVFRVAAAYVVVAWALLQAADIIFPALGVPPWAMTLVVVLAFLGFPVAVVLAWAFDITPEGVVRTPDASSVPDSAAPRRTSRRPVAAAAVLLLLGAALGVAWIVRGRVATVEAAVLDPAAVAVLPFRVSGDPALAYLREGMMDLLAATLTGEGGLRAVDQRTVISAWRRSVADERDDLPQDSAILLARALGSGQLLLGSVVGTDQRLTLNASLVNARSGEVRARATTQGPHDELPELVDRLVGELLALSAGHDTQRLANLTSTSLPALRAYLEGQALHRRGRYREAVQSFRQALDMDTTFALAGLGLADAAGFVPGFPGLGRGLHLAWLSRERLSIRDHALLTAKVGPRYPDPTPTVETIAAWYRALDLMPDRAEVWYNLGDSYFHDGSLIGLEDWQARAAEKFRRAIALDSTYAPALMHLVQLAGMAGDTASVRVLTSGFLAHSPEGETAEHLRWYAAHRLADEPVLRQVRSEMERMSWAALFYVGSLYGIGEGIHADDVDRALVLMEQVAATSAERQTALGELYVAHLARGRPQAALRVADAMRPLLAAPRAVERRLVESAIYSVGDSAAARQALARLRPFGEAPVPAGEAELGAAFDDLCITEQWRLWGGDRRTAAASIARLRGAGPAPASTQGTRNRACADLLDALLEVSENRPDARERLERFEAFLLTGPSLGWMRDHVNLAAARMHEQLGNPERALAAARRRSFGLPGDLYLSDHLREEARLAALTGDREGALRALRHLQALYSDPEPVLRPEAERVRAELSRLTGTNAP
jgi:tetratricopeptide (TPR) repeat protein